MRRRHGFPTLPDASPEVGLRRLPPLPSPVRGKREAGSEVPDAAGNREAGSAPMLATPRAMPPTSPARAWAWRVALVLAGADEPTVVRALRMLLRRLLRDFGLRALAVEMGAHASAPNATAGTTTRAVASRADGAGEPRRRKGSHAERRGTHTTKGNEP